MREEAIEQSLLIKLKVSLLWMQLARNHGITTFFQESFEAIPLVWKVG